MSTSHATHTARADEPATPPPHLHQPEPTRSSHRLPTNTRPTHYDLHLTPNLTSFTFQASLTILLTITQPTRTIHLNSAELTLHSATLTPTAPTSTSSSTSPLSATISYNKDDETAILTFPSDLSPGDASLSVAYDGVLNDKMRGCYRSKYTTQEGKDAWMVVTQFESTDARRALPCYDEPALKASFSVSLTVDAHLRAVSNMPIVESKKEGEGGQVTHCFDKSPVMSTYLLAWCVGEFDVIEDTTEDGILIRCFTPQGKGEQGRFALSVALRVLPFYNSFFQLKYPLPKLDMLAIDDFAAGAMENWGMVTYRTTALLIDEHNSSAQTRQNCALTVSHELSHQWFGNLVTMEWWEGLWLNEGFATWMENFATDRLFPDWALWDQFVYSDVNAALSLDSLLSSHPIEVQVERAEDVDEIFDAISYSKGSVVVRLLEDFLGNDTFTKGIQQYVKHFAYGNAKTDDLWAQLQAVSGKPVKEMMERWTKHVGFPLLTLTEGKQEANDVIVYGVTQQRFLVTGVAKDDDTLWYVPISFLVGGGKGGKEPVGKQVLREKTGQLRLEGVGALQELSWVKINPFQTGPYRVQYPPSMRAQFRAAIQKGGEGMTASDRLGLQTDLFALARAGIVKTDEVLEFVEAYVDEGAFVVWADLLGNLGELGDVLKMQGEVYEQYRAFVRRLIARLIERVGWEGKKTDDHCASMLRARAIGAGVKYGNESVKVEAQKRFAAYFTAVQAKDADAGKKVLPADLRGSTYACVVEHGGKEGYEQLLQLQKLTDLQEERLRCLHALGATTEPALITRSLDYAFSPAVRSGDAPSFIGRLASNPKATQLVWEYMKTHWDKIIERFGGTTGLSRMVGVVSHFSDEAKAKEVEAFFNSHPAQGAQQAIKQAIETLRSNAVYLERDGADIRQWLSQHADKPEGDAASSAELDLLASHAHDKPADGAADSAELNLLASHATE